MPMSSRERLLATLSGRPADRVPISTYELVGWSPRSWENHEPSYKPLMDAIREHTDCLYMADVAWRTPAADHPPGNTPSGGQPVDRYTFETWREGVSSYTRTTVRTGRGDLTSLHRTDDHIHTTWTLEPLLKSADDIPAYLSLPWSPIEVDMTSFYSAQEALGDNGLMMLSVPDPICEAAPLFELGEFLVASITEPVSVGKLMDTLHERQMHNLRQILANDVTDVVFRICGPEYATSPYLAPGDFRRYVTRYLADICGAIRNAGAFARVHCHGKIAGVLDQILDAGAQGLDPLEPPPDGDMALSAVKARCGGEVCLFGNIELKELEHSDRATVRELVRRAMAEGKEGGRFVLMPTAAPINVPLSPKTEANYMAYIEAGLEFGQY